MSIRPEFSRAIFSGNKLFEFRKRATMEIGDVIWVHETLPTSEIVGRFTVGEVIRESPSDLWACCGSHGAISQERFFSYFNGYTEAIAIRIDRPELLVSSFSTKEIGQPIPQSYNRMKMESLSALGAGG